MPRGHDDDFQGAFFAFEVPGMDMTWFTGCSGLSMEFDVVEFKEGDGTMTVERKRAGRPKYSEVVLKRGLTTSRTLEDWFQQVAQGKVEYKDASIVIYDREQVEGARFNLTQCWPSKLSVSDLQAGSDDVMVEEMTIQHEYIDWVK